MARTVIAIFESFDYAETAASNIREKGLRTDNISIIVKDKNNNFSRAYRDVRGRISDGIITGGIFGGIVGIIIGTGSLFVPDLEIISAAGPLTGLVSGLVAGGVVGGIIDIGIPGKRKDEYNRLILDGNTLFSMRVDEDRLSQIVQILEENNALRIEKY